MFKNYKKFILISLVLIGTLTSLFFIYKNCFEKKIITEPIKEPIEFLTIDIDGKTLVSEENNFIYSSFLRPKFNIFIPQNIDIESLSLKIDNSENVLVDEFYGKTSIDETKRSLTFWPSYMFTPEKHRLIVEYQNLNGKSFSLNSEFILVFNENFNEPLKNSKVWIIPQNRPSDWFNVKDSKLLAKPMTNDNFSSLAFLYTFEKDVTVDFELTPVKNKVSMIFYFLEIGSFTIGSNDNKTIVLIRENQPDLFAKSFELLAGHRYHIHITRKDFEYKLGIKELFNGQKIDFMDRFLEENILLNYADIDILNNNQNTFRKNHIGFSLWGNSDGVFIDDIFITAFAN
jgi:hypothetical protein